MDKYRNYQYEQLGDTNEEELTTKLLTDCDIDKERLMHSQKLDEVADLREQFNVYYSADIPQMRLREKLLEYREERKAANDDAEEPDEESLLEQLRTQLNIRAKPLTRSDYFTICKQVHLEGLVKKFGLKPDKLGENLYENYQKNEIDQYPIGPLATCEEYLCRQFSTPQTVLLVSNEKYFSADNKTSPSVVFRLGGNIHARASVVARSGRALCHSS